MICKYPDTVKLVETTAPDGYGDTDVNVLTDLKCIFHVGTGLTHSGHVDYIDSDAVALLDPNNAVLKQKAYRIEGMYIVAPFFNGIEQESWYRIEKVNIAQSKLTCNQIHTIHVTLKKTESK